MSGELITAIAEMNEEEALAITRQLIKDGATPVAILDDCKLAMEEVGKRFEKGEYFIPELILAGEMLKAISEEIMPLMAQSTGTVTGAKVLLGTVKGDIHDIGKDIVNFMLGVNGFQVKDLGVDITPEDFVAAIKEYKPDVVALSGFLTLAYTSMKETVDAIAAAGLRDSVKIMIGGGTMDQQICAYAGADAFGKDAMSAVALAKNWTGAN